MSEIVSLRSTRWGAAVALTGGKIRGVIRNSNKKRRLGTIDDHTTRQGIQYGAFLHIWHQSLRVWIRVKYDGSVLGRQ